jgi:predicted phage gp36 major capsid-like protein
VNNKEQINKLNIELVSHKTAIKDLQRERFQKIDEFNDKVEKEREKERSEEMERKDTEIAELKEKIGVNENAVMELQ